MKKSRRFLLMLSQRVILKYQLNLIQLSQFNNVTSFVIK